MEKKCVIATCYECNGCGECDQLRKKRWFDYYDELRKEIGRQDRYLGEAMENE